MSDDSFASKLINSIFIFYYEIVCYYPRDANVMVICNQLIYLRGFNYFDIFIYYIW